MKGPDGEDRTVLTDNAVNRREFIKKVGVVLPSIAVLGLASFAEGACPEPDRTGEGAAAGARKTAGTESPARTGCNWACAGSCSGRCGGSCSYDCSSTCKGSCYQTCTGSCQQTCRGTCSDKCGSGCSGTCSRSCSGMMR